MTLNDTLKQCKKIIKARKKNKKLYTKEEVKYAKLLKRRAEEKLEEKHANDNT